MSGCQSLAGCMHVFLKSSRAWICFCPAGHNTPIHVTYVGPGLIIALLLGVYTELQSSEYGLHTVIMSGPLKVHRVTTGRPCQYAWRAARGDAAECKWSTYSQVGFFLAIPELGLHYIPRRTLKAGLTISTSAAQTTFVHVCTLKAYTACGKSCHLLLIWNPLLCSLYSWLCS